MFNSVVHAVNRNVLPSSVSRTFLLCCTRIKTQDIWIRKLSLSTHPEHDRNEEKVIKVAILGVPNSGKSTLINNLVQRRVCPASNKVHTTKTIAKAICNEENTQIIFLDTPGVVSPKEKLRYQIKHPMAVAPNISVKEADIVGVIHDIGNPWTKDSLSPLIVKILEKNDYIPSFLVLNKIDMLKSKRRILDLVRTLSNGFIAGNPIVKKSETEKTKLNKKNGYSGFSDVFMVSALEGDGVDMIRKYLAKNGKPGKWPFNENDWTDQTRETLIMETVRAKFLDYLHQEIPYQLITDLEFLEEKADSDRLVCLVSVTCPSERIEKLIAGAGGGRLRQITDSARHDLVQMFHKSVSLTITLRVENNPHEE